MSIDFERPKPEEPEQIACEICLKEIPATVAKTAEGPDYIHHFCGIDCLDRWQKEKEPGEDEKAPE